MQGVGMGYAAEPLLNELKITDPARHREAVGRSTEFFNANPNLVGLALGALARAEYDGVPGPQIARLRTALSSPLGALGDRIFWAGLVPAFVAAAVAGLVLGAGWWAIAGLLFGYNVVRLTIAAWALRTGTQTGMSVGASIGASGLPKVASAAGPAAAFFVGLATPIVVAWYLEGFGGRATFGALAVAVAGLAAGKYLGPAFTTIRFAVSAIGLVMVLAWLIR
jgi:mannose/fructose/N-acetylgalactosamine-specific phosphotransferase system component IID